MSKELTKMEKYQFSLCGSLATTVAAQRAAIAREGLTGMTPAAVRKARQKAFKEWRATQDDLHKLPAWLAAARWEAISSNWLHVAPIPAGKPVDVPRLGRMAHDAVTWGRLKKHSTGDGTAFRPRVRENDNGKTGWDRVVWRYADYLCVLSPDRKHIAVQVDNEPITIHPVFRDCFLYRGFRTNMNLIRIQRGYRMTLRDTERHLKRHGYEARLVRQTAEMVQQGSGDNIRSGGTVSLVIPDGIGGFYHVCRAQWIPSIREALSKRRLAAKQKELDAMIETAGDRIWVTIEDSLAAGNCLPGTNGFIQKLKDRLKAEGELGAVTAKAILATTDNDFTRRACRVACLRKM